MIKITKIIDLKLLQISLVVNQVDLKINNSNKINKCNSNNNSKEWVAAEMYLSSNFANV